jgi:hypothetical protein
MLKYMDERGVIDRSDGIDPIIILDGHISRMMPTFLDYSTHPVPCLTFHMAPICGRQDTRRRRMVASKYQQQSGNDG